MIKIIDFGLSIQHEGNDDEHYISDAFGVFTTKAPE